MTVLAFVAALAMLIAVHEYGHFRVAVACGVKVLRFSVGFGPVILKHQSVVSGTEYVLCAVPMGGYVRMLDESEAPVSPAEVHRAFNRQSLWKRAAIVIAGPAANLTLAVFLYTCVNWSGVAQPRAILASPTTDSIAFKAGLQGGDHVVQAAFAGEEMQDVASFDDLRWMLTQGALDRRDLRLMAGQPDGARWREILLPLSQMDVREADATLLQKIGLNGPMTKAVIGERLHGGPADRAGLMVGDWVLSVDDQKITDGQQLRNIIRAAPLHGQTPEQRWLVQRSGKTISVRVQPDVLEENGVVVGRIGAYVGAAPEMKLVRYGFFDGFLQGVYRTWDTSLLTIRMMGRMAMGMASLKNLSGPITIADYAGKSAALGMNAYFTFIALISVSLGVLNLLPMPVLDGGHLMYYLWEGLTGRAVPEVWMQGLQRVGVAILLMMTSIALFNDLTRLLG